ncbi:MAG: 1-deoxy-D-xylulose-5-phosphate synthase [Eubacterium sp.]|nr:1-deoxy-D-xylulose-5-phosphate synthase [Eubacterium sp.]
MILDEIKAPNDIKNIPQEDLEPLAEEIREFLIEKVSKTGGHIASSLGAVELTMALHLVMDFPEDKLVWDVGHQAYTHKLLTGRKEGFDTLRQFKGMSGFPKTKESPCDSFNTGHSSTSISAALGMAKAREIRGENYKVAAVIGDGALTGGMAYEALNNASSLNSNMLIVLNDNNMSISENVGGLSKRLSGIRTQPGYRNLKDNVESSLSKIRGGDKMIKGIRKTKNSLKQMIIPGMFFEDMGITYLGPVDGHDIFAMAKIFKEAFRVKGAVLVHVETIKGKGYLPAERHPSRFHGIDKFDIETGLSVNRKRKSKYTDVFSTVIKKQGERNEKICAVTAAMSDGTGLKRFKHFYPGRFFDVGICEEHAVTFCAGLAISGFVPIFAVYSSFLQRGYDQIVHDVCMQNLHVIFAIDRAGLVGSDGETHHGIFDISYLSPLPNMHLMAPKNKWELSDMLKFAIVQDGPYAIRYPRGEAYDGLEEFRSPIEYGKSEMIYEEKHIALFAYGNMVKTAEKTRDILKEKGYDVTLVNARFAKPFDKEMIKRLSENHSILVTMEEGIIKGGLGESVADYVYGENLGMRIINIGIDDTFIEQGSVSELFEVAKIDEVSIAERIIKEVSDEKEA